MQTLTLRGVLAFKPESSHASVSSGTFVTLERRKFPRKGLPSSKVSGAGLWAIGATPWCIWKTVAQSVSVSDRGHKHILQNCEGAKACSRRSDSHRPARGGLRPRLAGSHGHGLTGRAACEQAGVRLA